METHSIDSAKPSRHVNDEHKGRQRWRVFTHALAFVLGFSLIFIVGWGGGATLLGELFAEYKSALAKIGGAAVILFGLHTLEWIRIPWFAYDTRPDWSGRSHLSGYSASGLMGIFFAAGWTPCVGTILGAILTLGMNQESTGQAMFLSSGYALGLGMPFLAMGLGVEKANQVLHRFRRRMKLIKKISGVLLLVLGVVILTNQLTLVAIWAQRNGYYLTVPFSTSTTPSYLISIFAGLLSFLSPCVLPLVPAYLGYLSGHAFESGNAGTKEDR